MYRDDRQALLLRITTLEAQLVEIEPLRQRVLALEAENARLQAALATYLPPPIPAPTGDRIGPELRLALRIPGLLEQTLSFAQDIVKIGRQKSAHIFIDHPTLSRMHAVIERNGETFTIVDLGSSSGTYINDRKVSKQDLKRGDVIRVGQAFLMVL